MSRHSERSFKSTRTLPQAHIDTLVQHEYGDDALPRRTSAPPLLPVSKMPMATYTAGGNTTSDAE